MLVDLQARHILVDDAMNSWSRRRIIPGADGSREVNPMLGFTGLGRNYHDGNNFSLTLADRNDPVPQSLAVTTIKWLGGATERDCTCRHWKQLEVVDDAGESCPSYFYLANLGRHFVRQARGL